MPAVSPSSPESQEPSRQAARGEDALPDFGDDVRATSARGTRADGGVASAVTSGCLSGVLANGLLGAVLLAMQRAGVDIYGPGAVAVLAGLVLLTGVLLPLGRRALLFVGAFVAGLLLFYAATYVLVRPALDSATSGAPVPQEQSRPPGPGRQDDLAAPAPNAPAPNKTPLAGS
jgi:hypothetical protein